MMNTIIFAREHSGAFRLTPMLKLLTVLTIFLLLSCKKKSEEKKVLPKLTTLQQTNLEINTFYKKLSKIHLEEAFQGEGFAESQLLKLLHKKELEPLEVRRVCFNHFVFYNSGDIEDIEISNYTPSKIKLYLKAKVPAEVVLTQILLQTHWHVGGFKDGVLTINCWGRPQLQEDYKE